MDYGLAQACFFWTTSALGARFFFLDPIVPASAPFRTLAADRKNGRSCESMHGAC